MLERWKERARLLKRSVFALYLAARHPRTPWYAKGLAALVAAYAFSPIDLIPDPIPVLGYLDDLVLLPLGIWLTLKLIPPEVWEECRARAEREQADGRPRSWIAAVVIIALWVAAIYLSIVWLGPIVARHLPSRGR
jgi:uncharacterized membrane protein YkvA (DUF1232 family)